MIKYLNYLLFSSVILIFISTIGMHGSLSTLFIGIGIVIFVVLSFLLLIIDKKFIIKVPALPIYIYLLFVGLFLFSFFSYYINGRLKGLVVYGALISLFITVRLLSIYVKNIDQFLIKLVFWVSISSLFIVVIGFLVDERFHFFRYPGFYTNANSMGMFTAFNIHLITGFLFSYNNLSKSYKYFYYTLLFIFFTLLFASNSRAALLSVLVVILLKPFFEFIKSIKFSTLKISSTNIKRSFFFLFLIILFAIFFYSIGFLDNILIKISEKKISGDISAGRIDSWIIMMKEWSFFGHKDLIEISDKNLIFGHNTWMSHLNYNGLLSLLFFLGWMIWMYKWAWKQLQLRATDKNKSVGLFIFIFTGYFINATFESATSTPGIITSLILFALIYKRPNLYNLHSIKKNEK